MNDASQWRYKLAQQVAPIYAANPHVAAVLVGGSTARGHADRFSDIELGVFWHQEPTDSDRQVEANHINGELVALYPYDEAEEVWCDDYMLGRARPDQSKSGILYVAACLASVHGTEVSDYPGRNTWLGPSAVDVVPVMARLQVHLVVRVAPVSAA